MTFIEHLFVHIQYKESFFDPTGSDQGTGHSALGGLPNTDQYSGHSVLMG